MLILSHWEIVALKSALVGYVLFQLNNLTRIMYAKKLMQHPGNETVFKHFNEQSQSYENFKQYCLNLTPWFPTLNVLYALLKKLPGALLNLLSGGCQAMDEISRRKPLAPGENATLTGDLLEWVRSWHNQKETKPGGLSPGTLKSLNEENQEVPGPEAARQKFPQDFPPHPRSG